MAELLRDLCPLVMSDMKIIADQPLVFTRVVEARALDLFGGLVALALRQARACSPTSQE